MDGILFSDVFFTNAIILIKIEMQLISHFNPPFNLMGNNNSINVDFRKKISSLRSNKKINNDIISKKVNTG